ncbi:DNA polymerase Y family protein [Cutibacterium equinum]|uniref:DNA polymerase Y family protein n=1 Tax=Cutibacterium equinum TaxID=3016342 RepID=A0ABY7QXV8_9ACTN|nr:DNA polymerase Y family protein [Cutibacterium equinum]WCC79362.1 DNA polymerase Y family protein [Cutibacterium equinum]
MPAERLSATPVRVLMAVIPRWRIVAASRRQPGDDPLLVVDRGAVVDCCSRAAEEGVIPGLSVRAAQLRCPDAVVVPHDPASEEVLFDEVVREIETSVAPSVHVVRPGVVAVTARGVARFYGGEHAAAQRMSEVLARIGYTDAGISVADGLFAAEVAGSEAASSQDHAPKILNPGMSTAFLASHDVSVLARTGRVDESLVRTLRQLGLTTLGAFAGLDRQHVVQRFAEAGQRAHDWARGMDVTVLSAHRLEDDDAMEVVLDDPEPSGAQVVAVVRPVAEEFMAGLAANGRVCSQARILIRATTGLSERTWRQPWQFSSDDLVARLSRQLDDLPRTVDEFGADEFCQSGVEAVRIVPTIHRAGEAAEGLFGARPTEHLVHVISQLQEKLGPEGVLVGEVAGGRMLKDRRRLVPFGTVAEDARPVDRPWPGHLDGPAPGIVYSRPLPARLETTDGMPLTTSSDLPTISPGWFHDGTSRRRVIAWAGPWPVHQRWWSTPAVSVERVQLVTEDQQAWVLAGSADRWWVEARYDEA